MNIYLISDEKSRSIANFLTSYLSPFFSDRVGIKTLSPTLQHQDFWTWEELFDAAAEGRNSLKKRDNDSYYIVLTNGMNYNNWFAAFNPFDASLGFVQTSGWDYLQLRNSHYAIAYHLVAIVTAMKFFGQDESLYSFYHDKSRGCIFDFTGEKQEVIYKLQSGCICKDCLQSMAQKAAGNTSSIFFLRAVKDIIEKTRKDLFEVNWDSFFSKFDYELIIQDDLKMMIRVNEEMIPLPISKGKEAAVFMMLLKYQNGLTYSDFEKPKIRKEYLSIYHKYFVNNCTLEEIIRISDEEVRQKTFKSNLQATISKIKKKMEKNLRLYPQIQRELLIQGGRGPIVIPIDRNLLRNNTDDLNLIAC